MRKTVVAVMLPREHLPFIREWCLHHQAQGFEVVLYDNTGSTGSARKSSSFAQRPWVLTQTDKRKRPYGRWSATMADEEVQQRLREQVVPLGVEVREWQPEVSGRIVHGQVEAYADFIRRERGNVDWAAFIDCDEYLEARGGESWDDLLRASNVEGRVRILGDSWECRWTAEGTPRRIEELRYVEHQGTGGLKNLVKLEMVEFADVHAHWVMRGGNLCVQADPRQFGFRHHANPGEAVVRLQQVPSAGGSGESVRV